MRVMLIFIVMYVIRLFNQADLCQ